MGLLIGIGAQKAGTTWLYECLRSLPGIAFPLGKEAHAWDAGAGVSEHEAMAWSEALARGAAGGGLACDITPAYAMLDEATIHRVLEHAPGARLVMLLRDPIERAWSAARMELARQGLDPASVDEEWFLAEVSSPGSLGRGDYLGSIERWSRVFGPDRLMVDFHERIATDPRGLLRDVVAHAGCNPALVDALPDALLAQRVFAGLPIAMPPAVRERLTRLYLPALERMAALPGWPSRRWLASAHRQAA